MGISGGRPCAAGLVPRGDGIPPEQLGRPRLGRRSESIALRWVVKHLLQTGTKAVDATVVAARLAEGFAMLRHVVGQDRVPEAHRLDQCRMSPADLGRLDVGGRIGLEDAVAMAVDRAEEPDAWIGHGVQRRDVVEAYGASPTTASGRSVSTSVNAWITTWALFSGSRRETYRMYRSVSRPSDARRPSSATEPISVPYGKYVVSRPYASR